MSTEDKEPRDEALEIAIRLVDHLGQMGAEECLLPVVDRAKEYIVRAAPKKTFDKEQAELDAVRKERDEFAQRINRLAGPVEKYCGILTPTQQASAPDCRTCKDTGWVPGVGGSVQCPDCTPPPAPAPPEEKRVICWSCKKPITEKLDLDLAELPNRGEPMCGACRGQDAD